jgi:hypothetical protein
VTAVAAGLSAGLCIDAENSTGADDDVLHGSLPQTRACPDAASRDATVPKSKKKKSENEKERKRKKKSGRVRKKVGVS